MYTRRDVDIDADVWLGECDLKALAMALEAYNRDVGEAFLPCKNERLLINSSQS